MTTVVVQNERETQNLLHRYGQVGSRAGESVLALATHEKDGVPILQDGALVKFWDDGDEPPKELLIERGEVKIATSALTGETFVITHKIAD